MDLGSDCQTSHKAHSATETEKNSPANERYDTILLVIVRTRRPTHTSATDQIKTTKKKKQIEWKIFTIGSNLQFLWDFDAVTRNVWVTFL